MRLENLPNPELLDQYEAMVRWNHYDPMGAKRPSKFGTDELKNELRRRLAGLGPSSSNSEGSEED